MDTEQVVEKILSEAKAEADKINQEANQKASEQKAKLESELADFTRETEQVAQAAGEEKKARMLATARMDIRKDNLWAKVALLNEVFEKARERVKTLPDREYLELIESLMLKSVESGDEEVIIGAKDNRISNGLIKNINRQLGPEFKGNMQLAKDTADIEGGFILRRGKTQINVSVDVLISQAREMLEMELSNELFGNEDN